MYKEKLKTLRENNSLTLQDISKLLNFEKDTYGKYEREYTTMPLKHLNTLCNYFNVSLDYIFNFNNIPNYENSQKEINKKLAGIR